MWGLTGEDSVRPDEQPWGLGSIGERVPHVHRHAPGHVADQGGRPAQRYAAALESDVRSQIAQYCDSTLDTVFA